ncbi:MAG TPA: 3' terminal RNA ribose 2'-O-methyltransferase Hen1 [Verrucomicrobiota bacterium]|nr:3' terminal RNA ribose 2'-O-methyltransferase Hen1 [Verrucomicrobiota bacterium]HNU52396.1 3' terminal RNA ribose 2'-O-methyltransferase Hen1 [Verrucomicrobiota bacterium]
MLLTLSTTHRPATDLGFLLRKNPARAQSFDLSFGRAHVFYPEAREERCTAALLVEVDPVGLVRSRRGPSGEGGLLDRYVNDRPYAASSFLSVAIADVFGTALAGHCKERPELADQPIPLRALLSAMPCRGGEAFLRKLFQPLGYRVAAVRFPLDDRFPAWGESAYHRVELEATLPLHQLLSHLYVLVPVLDNDKHYWVGDDEVQKLLRHGEGWLASHPERDAITRRYLKHQRSLVTDALAQLAEESDLHPDEAAVARDAEEAALESSLRGGTGHRPASTPADLTPGTTAANEDEPTLNAQRLGAVLAVLKAAGAQSVLDLGCGEGRLLQRLLRERQFVRITGLDVSHRMLENAADNLRVGRLPARERERLTLLHGSLMYRDQRLAGFDAAAVVEVIEHLDPPRLAAFERVLFEFARPRTAVITTPNREYNRMWDSLPAGQFRHRDHRFEWTRAEFQSWATAVAARFHYAVRFLPVGPEDAAAGSPTQMAVFNS